MAKYTTNFKLSVIAHYQSNHSYKRTAKHFGLDHKTVELWVKLHQTHGIDGIQRRSTKTVYDTTFKLNVIKQIQKAKKQCQINTTPIKTTKNKSTNKTKPQDDDYTKLLKHLEYLEAENAYLKKLDALICQKEQSKNKP